MPFEALYDTGAAISCLDESVFRQIPIDSRPNQCPRNPLQEFHSASGDALTVKGIYAIDINILGKSINHKFCVIKNLSEKVIIGADFINQHALCYCPITATTNWAASAAWERGSARLSAIQTVPAFTSRLVPVKIFTSDQAKPHQNKPLVANVIVEGYPELQGGPSLITTDIYGKSLIEICNMGPHPIELCRDQPIAIIENAEESEVIQLNPKIINTIAEKEKESFVQTRLPISNEKKKFIIDNAILKVPEEKKESYLKLLLKHHEVFSLTKSDLGRADLVMHEINVKNNEPIFIKQFKIPDSHRHYLEDQVREWLQLGIVQPSRSRYNSPLFLVKKKDGTFRVVQDFRALNANSYVDKYTMQDVTECINEIGRSNSTIFSTLDLTSGFWQMLLHPKSRQFTAFTLPGMGQFEWITSSMGLLGCPASFQRLVEAVVHGIANIIVYIDDLIVHSANHDDHLKQLDQLFVRLAAHNLKVKLQKCVFGSKQVQYLGFLLSEDGIRPGTDKLKAVSQAQPPATVKEVRQFLGLCNFFRTHVRNFAQVSAPLTALTRKDATWVNNQLPPAAMTAFRELQSILCSEPVISYPRKDREYALITDASLGDDTHAGGLGAILTQTTADGTHNVIAYASRKLQKHECNYTPFLLEMQAAIWGMEHFETYLRGKHFILYTDHKPLEKLGKVHTRTFNRLQELMNEFDFEICYKKGSEMPADFLSRNAVDSIDFDMKSLAQFQDEDEILKLLKIFLLQKQLPFDPAMRNLIFQLSLSSFIEDGVLWTRLKHLPEKRVVILAPNKIIPEILKEAHGHILSGHDGLMKTKERILQSYYWPGMDNDITRHIQTCHTCQVRKPSRTPPPLMSPLPQCTAPNQRIHADLFGPLTTVGKSKKMILCVTDAFTKYVELVALTDKEALTVTSAIFNRWICRFGLPLEIITDQGREFNNKMSEELYSLLKIHYQTTSARHPQCNSQAEVCNKTIAKYLNSFVDKSTLDWEQYLPPLMFSYNTSFHRSIKNTPYMLTFGMEPRLPSFPNPDLKEKFYGESSAAEMFQKLQLARQLATENNLEATSKNKTKFDEKAKPHSFAINQLVLLEEYNFLGRNQKLSPKFSGPHIILNLKGTHNAEILMKNKRKVIVNVQRLKPYFSSEFSDLVDSKTDFPSTSKENNKNDDLHIPPIINNANELSEKVIDDANELSEKVKPKTGSKSEEKMESDYDIAENLNTFVFPSSDVSAPPPVKKKKGRPPGPRIPTPPPFLFQNKGGIGRTRSQTAKERQKEKDEKEETAVSSLMNNPLICFEKCVNNKHTKLCLRKALNFLERGDTYINQKSAHLLSHDLNFDDNEQEEEEEEEDPGLGGSSPIPSVHYSFDNDETLDNIPEEELQDEFSQDDENFLSAVDEFKLLSSSMNETLVESQLSKEEQEETVLAETQQVRHKVEELLPKISPALRKELYSKINWSRFSPGATSSAPGPSTSTPARATRSSGQVKDQELPARPLEYKTLTKKK